MKNIKIYYKHKEYIYPKGTTLIEISKDFQKDFKHPILAGKINGEMRSLDTEVMEDAQVKFYDINRSNGNRVYERTAIFILSKAVKDVTGKDLYVEHSIDRGIYCLVGGLTEELLNQINERMQEIMQEVYGINSIQRKYISKYDKLESILSCDSDNKRAKMELILVLINEGYRKTVKEQFPEDYKFVEEIIYEYYKKIINIQKTKKEIDDYCI